MGTSTPEKVKPQQKKEQAKLEEQRPTTEEVKAARKAARKARKTNASNSK
jgi:rRNA maturation endonuclease Nob1